MAENVTPVTLEVKDFKAREVILVDYKFNQATDREGQISGIPRGGRINIRVKALNDGNAELLGWMLAPTDPRDFTLKFQSTGQGHETAEGHRLLLREVQGVLGRRRRALRGHRARMPEAREWSCSFRKSLEVNE